MNTPRNCQSCKYYKDGYCEDLELEPKYPDVGCDDFEIKVDKNDVLDKIRAEIEQAADKQFQIAMGIADLNERYTHIQMENAYRHSLNIIDKYREPQESEEV